MLAVAFWSFPSFGGMLLSLVLSVPVEIETVSGDVQSGTWAGVGESAIRIRRDSGVVELPFDQIATLRPAEPPEEKNASGRRVLLVGGSEIAADRVTLREEQLTIDPRRQDDLVVPIQRVRAIRFRQPSAATDTQWLGLLEDDRRTDVMVIRRGEQLDPIEGVVAGLTADSLQFELDGNAIDAPLDRLEGVLLRQTAGTEAKTTVKVVDQYGSVFHGTTLAPTDDSAGIEIRLPGDVRHTIRVEQIRSISWAGGLMLLARESPAELVMEAVLATAADRELVRNWFGPHGRGDDLIAVAGGRIEYRVEDDYESFAGGVRRDADVVGGGRVTVRILVDGSVRWKETLTGSEAKGFRIPLADANRLRLEVDSGDDGDVGDTVRFVKPRLLK